MRLLRVLAMAAGCAALLPQSGAAQDGRQFKDAWFWGLKAGGLLYSSQSASTAAAPLVGGEWLITRSRGGLYVSFDQAFLSTTGGFVDRDPDSTSAFIQPVNLRNLRRVSIAAMVFPMQGRNIHPYAGLGLSLHQIGSASLVRTPTNPFRAAIALDSIQSRKASFSPILVGGAQYRFRRFSAFAQATASPTQQSFFLYNFRGGPAFNVSLETGLRYNVGSSIDRAR